MLGDVSRCSAVLPAESEALRKPKCHEQHRGPDADLRIGRQHANERGREAHHDDRDQEGVLAAYQVADAPEDQRAEGPHGETRAEGRQAREEGRRLIARRKEERRKEDGERAVQVKVVPLEYGAERRGKDDAAMCRIDPGLTGQVRPPWRRR